MTVRPRSRGRRQRRSPERPGAGDHRQPGVLRALLTQRIVLLAVLIVVVVV